MICVSIKGPTLKEALNQLEKAEGLADLVEMRFDLFEIIDINEIKELQKSCALPMIFTLRSLRQGGSYSANEGQRIAELKNLATLEPAYLDLDYSLSFSIFEYVKSQHPKIQLIVSYHDFNKTPADLPPLLNILHQYPADYIKIATMAKNSLDAFSILQIQSKRTLAISMGDYGQISRILAPLYKSPWTYAALDESSVVAPGQLTSDTLNNLYHYKNLDDTTIPYGLLGSPVSFSFGDIVHNQVMFKLKLKAIYVKIETQIKELKELLGKANYLGFAGFSVTMPLKEEILKIISFPDKNVQAIGAANTLYIKDHQIYGFNTDGQGALDAIQEVIDPTDKHIVVLGAGGAAKAIIYEAVRRGAKVTIANRTIERAQNLALRFNCSFSSLKELPAYDILINATSHEIPIDPSLILPDALVMDISVKPNTKLLLAAAEKGCKTIQGSRMWIHQALGQYKIWFPEIDLKKTKDLLERSVKEALSKHSP